MTRAILKKIKARLRDIYWNLYGRRFRAPVLKERPGTFLFLCHGNICRSPFAERYARRHYDNDGLSLLSAGIAVTAPNPPPPEAVSAARQFDVPMTDHRSQQVTDEMMETADAILVMEISQFNKLRRRYPLSADRIYPLALFENPSSAPTGGYEKYNIQDPYGKPEEEFRRCYRRISRCLDRLLQS